MTEHLGQFEIISRMVQNSLNSCYFCKHFNRKISNVFASSEKTVITIPPSDTDATVGESIVLPCQVSHDPSLDVVFSWSFNGQRIDLSRGIHHFERIGRVSFPNPLMKFFATVFTRNKYLSYNSSLAVYMPGKSLFLYKGCNHLFFFPKFHRGAWVICEAIIKMSPWKKLMIAMNILI